MGSGDSRCPPVLIRLTHVLHDNGRQIIRPGCAHCGKTVTELRQLRPESGSAGLAIRVRDWLSGASRSTCRASGRRNGCLPTLLEASRASVHSVRSGQANCGYRRRRRLLSPVLQQVWPTTSDLWPMRKAPPYCPQRHRRPAGPVSRLPPGTGDDPLDLRQSPPMQGLHQRQTDMPGMLPPPGTHLQSLRRATRNQRSLADGPRLRPLLRHGPALQGRMQQMSNLPATDHSR
jgi:hypothetical protein